MTLVLDGRELPLGIVVQGPRREHHENRGRDDRRTHLQRAVEQPRVGAAHDLEPPIDQLGELSFLALGVHEPRAHYRRQGHRDDAGDDDRGRQRDSELEEQRTGEAALESDRRVHRGERDGHRDDGANELARADKGRLQACLSKVDVPFHILDDDDRVIDHQSDREHDRQNGQQVETESERHHDGARADQRHGHRD